MSVSKVCRRRGCDIAVKGRACPRCGNKPKYKVVAWRDGRRAQLGTFDTLKEAQDAERGAVAGMAQGTYVPQRGDTVGAYLNHRLDIVAAMVGQPDGVKSSTMKSYRGTVRNHLEPHIGTIRLQSLTTADLRRLYAKLRENGLSSKSVRNVHAFLRTQLGVAVEDGLIASNPAAVRSLVKSTSAKRDRAKRQRDVTGWDLATINRFLDTTDGDDLYPMWALAFATGLRRGELLALTWNDIDLDAENPSVRVSKAFVRGENGIELTDTKAGEVETVPILLGRAVDALRASCDDRDGTDLLIFHHGDGTRLDPDVTSTTFTKAVAKSKIVPRITLHGTRHSFVIWTLQADFPLALVSKWARHSTQAFTADHYHHVVPSDHTSAFEKARAAEAQARAVPHLKVVGE